MQNKRTKEIWHAKIFDNETIKFYGMRDSLEYNIEVLVFCKNSDRENIIYVEDAFTLGNKIFLIQEQFDTTLIKYVEK